MTHPNKQALYAVQHPFGKYPGLALFTRIDGDGMLEYFCTTRWNALNGALDSVRENGFVWVNKSGVFEFSEVTLERYREELAGTIVGGAAVADICNTTEDLWAFYRRQFR